MAFLGAYAIMLASSSWWKSTFLAYGANNNICRGGIVFLLFFAEDIRLLWYARWRYFPRVIWSQSVLNLEALGLVNGEIEYLI